MRDIIETNKKILGGQPVIKGTRIPVSRVLALIGMNYSLTEIKAELPDLEHLTKEDVMTMLSYYQNHLAA